MADEVREVLLTAVRAGRHGAIPPPSVAQAITEGSHDLTTDQLNFDSYAWMEFCISVELQSGLELTPAEVAEMRYVCQIEKWLRARF
jgi:hypothetical protein